MNSQYDPDVSSGFTDRSAPIIGESDFDSFFGPLIDINGNDSSQLKKVYYEPKDYLQGHLQSAYQTAYARNQAMRMELKGQWRIVIKPQNHEILIDCDEDRLRTYCSQPVSNPISVNPVKNNKPVDENKFKNAQTMESFLWKVALWSSRGRIPANINLKGEVSLNRWPNITRCLVTPHALHISALLSQRPYSLLQTAEILQIRHQYVFAFFSGAYALGYIDQEQGNKPTSQGPDLDIPKPPPARKIRKPLPEKKSNKPKGKLVRKQKKKITKNRKGFLAKILFLFRRS